MYLMQLYRFYNGDTSKILLFPMREGLRKGNLKLLGNSYVSSFFHMGSK